MGLRRKIVACKGRIARCFTASGDVVTAELEGRHPSIGVCTHNVIQDGTATRVPADKGASEFAHHLTIVTGRELFQRFKMHVIGNESN